jgi:hypothetical protein
VLFIHFLLFLLKDSPVSVQTVFASVNSFVIGLDQIDDEIRQLKKSAVPPNDRFVLVMQVS